MTTANSVAQNALTANSSMLEVALQHAREGFPVFMCRPRDKDPLIPKEQGGAGFRDATTDEAQIRAWWSWCPDANVGMVVPEGYVVLDVDPRNGGSMSMLPDVGRTRIAVSGRGDGGKHVWYQLDPELTLPGKLKDLGPGIDVRMGGRSYVVAPGSIHPDSGKPYAWEDVSPIATAPEWLRKFARPRGQTLSAADVAAQLEADDLTQTPEAIAKVAELVTPFYTEGQRHDLAKYIGGWLKQRGWTPADVAAVISHLNPCTDNVLRAAAWAFTSAQPFGWAELEAIMGKPYASAMDCLTPNPRREREKRDEEAVRAVIEKHIPPMAMPANAQGAHGHAIVVPPDHLPFFVRAGVAPEWSGTDQGNAELFAAHHQSRVRWIPSWQKWAAFDGKRWTLEFGPEIARRSWHATLRQMNASAAEELDPVRAKAITAYAKKCMTHRAEESALALAKSRLAIDHRAFDRDHWVLNTLSGILHLRTGELYPHDPSALCTKLAPVTWDPNATCPGWLEFLNWAMLGDTELVAYLQRFFGLCLTGDASHEILTIFQGGGGNGKTTALTVFESLLGDYSVRAPARLLMAGRGETHPTELADFAGRRLVVLAETKEEQCLDDQIVKLVASRDEIAARRMREDFWRFSPTHKAILMTNPMPRVRGQDHGIWRRLALVPWRAKVAEQEKDPKLPEKLKAELPGILAWACRGLGHLPKTGLQPPAAMRSATSDFRKGEDVVGRWIEEECERGDKRWTEGSASLLSRFNAWARGAGEVELSAQAFATRMSNHGIEKVRDRKGAFWIGIRVRPAM